MIISVSGMDGTGKSTSSNYIADLLKDAEYDVKLIHMTGKYLSPTNYVLSKCKKLRVDESNITRVINKKNTKEQKGKDLLFLLRPIFLMIDIYIVYVLFILPLRYMRKMIVCDRYFYDYVIDTRFRGRLSERGFSFLLKVIPKPEISLLLTVSPTISHDRDQDFDIKIHHEKSKLYLECESLFDYRIDTNRNLDVLQKETKRIIMRRLKDGWR